MNNELNTVQRIFDAVVELQNDHATSYNALSDEYSKLEIANHELELKCSRMTTQTKLYTERLKELSHQVDATLSKLEEYKSNYAESIKRNEDLNTLVMKQKNELGQLLQKHNTEVMKANTTIASLQKQLENANRALKIAKCKKDKAAAGREVVWQQGHEKLRSSQMIKATIDGKATNTNAAMWWEHDKGFQLMCVYDSLRDEVMICDPRNDDDELILPSDIAIAQVRASFKKSMKKVG